MCTELIVYFNWYISCMIIVVSVSLVGWPTLETAVLRLQIMMSIYVVVVYLVLCNVEAMDLFFSVLNPFTKNTCS